MCKSHSRISRTKIDADNQLLGRSAQRRFAAWRVNGSLPTSTCHGANSLSAVCNGDGANSLSAVRNGEKCEFAVLIAHSVALCAMVRNATSQFLSPIVLRCV